MHRIAFKKPLSALSKRSFATNLKGLPFDIHPEVAQALSEGKPIVALESTLVSHGLPPPDSSVLPKECEAILRAQGVTPATISIIDGRVKVGTTEAQIDLLAEQGFAARKNPELAKTLWKVGRREIPAVLAKGVNGGTTVSGTMAIAHLAGIKIFSTGGIGGVHRGAETTFDISSDLISLSDTPVTVVCAGSKSILDIGLTLEYLETQAVTVGALKTADWPAFYTPRSGFKAPLTFDSLEEVAQTISNSDKLGFKSGVLLGVPIPEPFHAVGEKLQEAVELAVAESIENGMAKRGKEATPWLLGRVAELTKGSSVASNMALIRNNVQVGGELALAYHSLVGDKPSSFQPAPAAEPKKKTPIFEPSRLLVVGSLAMDISMIPADASPLHTTAPGTVALTLGGVAGNVAGAARSLGISDVVLVAPKGNDLLGEAAATGLEKRGIRSDGLVEIAGASTPTCGYLVDEHGELIGGVADMHVVTELTSEAVISKIKQACPQLVCLDGNLSVETIAGVIGHCQEHGIETFYEPTSNSKALRILGAVEKLERTTERPPVTYVSPNIHEVKMMFEHATASHQTEKYDFTDSAWINITVDGDAIKRTLPSWVHEQGIVQMCARLLPVFQVLFVKNGSKGVIAIQRVEGTEAVAKWARESRAVVATSVDKTKAITVKHYDGLKVAQDEVLSVTGAGDNLAGAILSAIVSGFHPSVPQDLDTIVNVAQKAAVNTLKSHDAVGDHEYIKHMIQ